MSKKINIGIVGFGRIGRNLLRLGYSDPRFNFVGISDFAERESLFYLLGHDSLYGPVGDQIELKDNYIYIGNQKIRLLPSAGPDSLPWDSIGIDIIVDCTGRIWSRSDLDKYLYAGAKRVIVTKPPKDPVDRIVVMGLNDKEISSDDKIISSSSSTTQVLALMLDILDREFGLKMAMMTSVHSYTSDQPLADSVRSDLRRSRSAVENIIPNQTQAPYLVEKIMPQHKNKIKGIAFNVPVPDGSCLDLTTQLNRVPKIEEVNKIVKDYSETYKSNIISYTTDPIVSSDVIGNCHTMVFDL